MNVERWGKISHVTGRMCTCMVDQVGSAAASCVAIDIARAIFFSFKLDR